MAVMLLIMLSCGDWSRAVPAEKINDPRLRFMKGTWRILGRNYLLILRKEWLNLHPKFYHS